MGPDGCRAQVEARAEDSRLRRKNSLTNDDYVQMLFKYKDSYKNNDYK